MLGVLFTRQHFLKVALVALASFACSKVQIDRAGRPCDDGKCAAGFVCNPMLDRCVREMVVDCVAGICPSRTATGDPCGEVGAFIPCTDQAEACKSGCRVCREDLTWGGCLVGDCDIGRVEACSSCADDCRATVEHATPICNRSGVTPVCSYAECEAGFSNADRNPSNGCETQDCVPECAGRCGGDDGCLGTCPDHCIAPLTCGGGGVVDVCGCIPDCSTKCGGDDNCGGLCPETCTPPETCGGGGVSNACGWWWSCNYPYRRRLIVTAGSSAVPTGFSTALLFDHGDLVDAGRSLASGDDFRIVRWTGTSWHELDRVADPVAPFNASTNTIVWFQVDQAIAAGATDLDYFVYYGAADPGAPPDDESKVFVAADFFDRPDSPTVGGAWQVVDASTGATGDVGIVGSELTLVTTGDTLYNRPLAQLDFAPPAGDFVWRFRMNWARVPSDATYYVMMQLGEALLMDDPPGSESGSAWQVGVGVNLVWGGSDTYPAHEQLWCTYDNLFWDCAGTTVSGPHEIKLVVHPSAKTYDVVINGFTTSSSQAFDTDVTTLNRMRLMTWGVADNAAGLRAFSYVLVRQSLASEPSASLSGEELHFCP